MRAVHAACVAVLCGWAPAAFAAPPEVPKSLTVRPGQIVRVPVKADDKAAVGMWRSFTDEQAFFAELAGTGAGARQFAFQSETPGTYTIVFWSAGETGGVAVVITVGDPGPKPPAPPKPDDPIPPPKPKPDPTPDELGMVKASRDGLAAVGDFEDKARHAAVMAKGLRAAAAKLAAGGIPFEVGAIRREVQAACDAIGGGNTALWVAWDKTVSAKVVELDRAGRLREKAAWVQLINEIAAGLGG